ncbi:MAG TPA: preprotein translocase subunit YajC [Gaiellaceae bacterium]
MNGFLILVVILALFWALLVMPRRRRQQSHAAMQDALNVDDEVITAGGLHGHIRELDSDVVKLAIADGVIVTVDRRAIAAVAQDIEVEVEPEPEAEPHTEHETGEEPS